MLIKDGKFCTASASKRTGFWEQMKIISRNFAILDIDTSEAYSEKDSMKQLFSALVANKKATFGGILNLEAALAS